MHLVDVIVSFIAGNGNGDCLHCVYIVLAFDEAHGPTPPSPVMTPHKYMCRHNV